MRAFVFVASCALSLGLGCGGESDDSDPIDAAIDAFDDADVPEVRDTARDTTPSAFDSAEPPGSRDTDIGPVGHCLYDDIAWTCRAGHICTYIGKCTPDDAGPSEAGSEPCGLVFCDKEFCRCRTASVGLCDCN